MKKRNTPRGYTGFSTRSGAPLSSTKPRGAAPQIAPGYRHPGRPTSPHVTLETFDAPDANTGRVQINVGEMLSVILAVVVVVIASAWAWHTTIGFGGKANPAAELAAMTPGDGTFTTLSANSTTPIIADEVRGVAVSAEDGMGVNFTGAAEHVLATLNDDRGWTSSTGITYAPTSLGPGSMRAAIHLVIVSTSYYQSHCPVSSQLNGACFTGDHVLIDAQVWVGGSSTYPADRDELRQYLVNHGVGLAIGQKPDRCRVPGSSASVMMPQTSDLKGCQRNPWPNA